ncbi:hypothetical protein AVEN_231322-1 [Araneus ventricosus]|uniref:Uncharacterized protein n=1 Tax=Araneus ventricosus TaxID=182803 RepID=A0A4Y2CJC4_ARAVE|nr:hypothetical protein AVEN_231322-1 [Araneus ventricosus]
MYSACAKIWLKYEDASMIPWAIHIPKNQVCNDNSFPDIMKNVLRMSHAKYKMTYKKATYDAYTKNIHLNFRTTAAIVMEVVSRYSKMSMNYAMRPLTATPGGILRS